LNRPRSNTANGKPSLSPAEAWHLGCYTAKWRKVRDEWVIEAEIYLTLA
jgi:hypothetical protein